MESYLTSILKQFTYYKSLGEKAMAQLSDEQLFWQYNDESNSIAIIVQHLSGNMLSRFTDFLTSDGEKPWRNRDAEFEVKISSKTKLMEQWNKGWECFYILFLIPLFVVLHYDSFKVQFKVEKIVIFIW